MTTFISDQAQLAALEQREREAWATYTETLRDLQGKDYEDAEDESWDRLQKTLKQLEEERQLLVGA
jgi:hypothetical protein